VRHPKRDALGGFLAERGIATGLHYPVPIHLQPAYAELGYTQGSFPVAERWATQCLSLPIHPELSSDQIVQIGAAVHEFDVMVR
jgi:dTDP-4-amino-4,6-dideoxygalactose transaminase